LTDTEKKLWWRLRMLKREGFHFRRQVPIDHLIVDFAGASEGRRLARNSTQ
jgi:very-short-patch-repair endonuclease